MHGNKTAFAVLKVNKDETAQIHGKTWALEPGEGADGKLGCAAVCNSSIQEGWQEGMVSVRSAWLPVKPCLKQRNKQTVSLDHGTSFLCS